jgi:ribonuclease HII
MKMHRAHHDSQQLRPTREAENAFWQRGLAPVAGLDEAGRGPWAGPVYAAAVVLPEDVPYPHGLEAVRDSKVLSCRQRNRLFDAIASTAVAVGAASATAEEIDELGIVAATRLAMQRALDALPFRPQALILDAITLPGVDLPQHAFPRADAHSLAVAAAGIVAKVLRDRWMVGTAEYRFPGYGFAQHKGYGTRQHQEALERLGVCALHRRSFRPMATLLTSSPDRGLTMSPGEKSP